jgi:hypothetical protein
MEEQRTLVRSSDLAEQLAAALLIPGLLRERLRKLDDFQLGQVLDREVCSNLSVLAPELTVCIEVSERLCRRGADKTLRPRRSQATKHADGDHVLHTESALYWVAFPTSCFHSRGTGSRANRSRCRPWQEQRIVYVRQDFKRVPAPPRC